MLMDPGAEPSELAVETLLADLALTRLGTLLQGAREHHSSSRRDVANKVGTTARELRRYETGATPVPPGIVNALAEFYGAHLGADFSHRGASPIEAAVVAEAPDAAQGSTGDADEVLRAYVGILGREPQRTPDTPVTLRADDIAALSATLAVEPEYVKGRIAELLTFTTGLRRKTRLRRRKRLLSGAGIAVLLATAAGFGIGSLVGAAPSPAADQPTPVVPASLSTTAASSTTVARSSTTVAPSSTTTVAAPPAPVVPPPAVILPPPATDPPPTALGIGTAVTVVETTTTASSTTTTTATTTTTFPRPVVSTDTTPVSIPGTEPVTIITSP
jgi:transcriptional regulator with XRE-family HTH domain